MTELTNRVVILDDAEILYEWANDSVTRSNSFNTGFIEWEEHCKWFKNKLADNNCLMLMFCLENKPVGVVNFQIRDKNAIIGITLSPGHRGKGLGAKIILSGCSRFWETHCENIIAKIKKTNIASIKSFKKAGFSVYEDSLVRESEDSLVLKIRKNNF